MSRSERSQVKRHFRLSTPGEPIPTETVWIRPGDPPTMRVLLPWRGWERIVREERLGLSPDQVPDDLLPDTDVMVEAELRDGVEFPDDVAALRTQLARPETPLRSSESWTVTDVYQADSVETVESPGNRVFDEEAEERVQSVDVGMQQLTVEPVSETEVGPPLSTVADALDSEGWPYTVEGETELLLAATTGDSEWDVRITAVNDSLCRITSVYPEPVSPGDDADMLVTALEYSGDCRRGGFVYDGATSELQFRTPFVPSAESTVDALTENVTSLAEHL